MTEPLTTSSRVSGNGAFVQPAEPVEDSPPSTPAWVKALGIGLVVLLLVFAGLHLTGNAPTHMDSGGMQHSLRLP